MVDGGFTISRVWGEVDWKEVVVEWRCRERLVERVGRVACGVVEGAR